MFKFWVELGMAGGGFRDSWGWRLVQCLAGIEGGELPGDHGVSLGGFIIGSA